MEKITPAVIASFIIGIIIGYLVHGYNKPVSSAQTAEMTATASPVAQTELTSNSKINEALSAAPESLRANAAVMDYPSAMGASPTELRKGTNDWSCFPDYPSSPGKDPMCLDQTGMEWMQAYMTQKPPAITQPGLAYMLAGGSDASNTDPFAEKPTGGDDWITSPAHIMVLPAGKLDQSVYGTDPKKGGSWIMWAGTPYEHLMMPVK